MARSKNPPPPPERPGYSEKIRGMENGGSLLFDGAKPESIKVLCSKLSARLSRRYVTAKENGGVRVWRTR